MAPATSSHRKCRLPCFEILPSLSLPPVECCLGTNPIQAARLRPDENTVQSPTSAQGGGDDRADTGYFFQPSAFFARSVPGMDVLLDVSNLDRHSRILPSQGIEAQARCRRDAIVLLIGNDLEQFGRAFAAFRRDNAELRQMSADRIRQHRALADEKLSAAM